MTTKACSHDDHSRCFVATIMAGEVFAAANEDNRAMVLAECDCACHRVTP